MKRIEYFCPTCRACFTVWWTGDEDPPNVRCPVCYSCKVKREGEYDYSRHSHKGNRR